ncbi:MAG TPA: NAD(+) diphosphatase [Actinomycetes bacterium]|nr:NAD(+) diphosphatase [Actinomycetes bacterium]
MATGPSVSSVIDDSSPLTDLTFGFPSLDRAAHRRADEHWLARQWDGIGTRVLRVADGKVPTTAGIGSSQPELRWESPSKTSGERYFLGVDAAGQSVFALRVDELSEDDNPAGVRELATRLDAIEAGLLVHAVALANWHSAHQFCPRCGAATQVVMAGAERRCTKDGSSHFPRTDPAVIVLVTDPQERALLGRQSAWPPGRFSTLAGFVEPGETSEQAVMREVFEESSIEVTDVRYLGSQPWPFPASLMLGFSARSAGARPTADGVELEQVRWFSRDEFAAAVESGEVIPPGGISIARRLVERWFGGPLPESPGDVEWR